jgi:hypothetical protein
VYVDDHGVVFRWSADGQAIEKIAEGFAAVDW